MQDYLISLLIFTPLLAAIIGLVIPARAENSFRLLALVASVMQVLILIQVLQVYSFSGGLQLVERQNWITLNLGDWGVLKAEYFVGADGLSLPLVVLSVVVILIAVISSWTISKNIKGYFTLLLILNAAVIGTFTALDFLLFYLFFEFML